jgi:putative redox protein
MEEKKIEVSSEGIEKSLKGYKENIPLVSRGILTWEKDLVFTARIRGYSFEYDPTAQEGCVPTDTLLMSLPGCLAIDVLSFLQKMRVEIKSFDIETTGDRNPTPPQYFKAINMTIRISGNGITPKKLDRVISLSQEKYCSVYHSLRKDIDVKVSYVIEENVL